MSYNYCRLYTEGSQFAISGALFRLLTSIRYYERQRVVVSGVVSTVTTCTRNAKLYKQSLQTVSELSLGEKCARITEQTSFFAVTSWLIGAPFLLGPSHFTFCLARDVRKGCTLSPSQRPFPPSKIAARGLEGAKDVKQCLIHAFML